MLKSLTADSHRHVAHSLGDTSRNGIRDDTLKLTSSRLNALRSVDGAYTPAWGRLWIWRRRQAADTSSAAENACGCLTALSSTAVDGANTLARGRLWTWRPRHAADMCSAAEHASGCLTALSSTAARHTDPSDESTDPSAEDTPGCSSAMPPRGKYQSPSTITNVLSMLRILHCVHPRCSRLRGAWVL